MQMELDSLALSLEKKIFELVGGLDESLKCAFDYDLFVKILKISTPYFIDKNIAFVRDYSGTLSRRNKCTQGVEIIKVARRNGAKYYNKIVISNFVKKVLMSKLNKKIL
jgi:hypothetical protein